MPRSFLVKKNSLAKRRLSQDHEHGNESSDSSTADTVDEEQSTPRADTTEKATIEREVQPSSNYSITELTPPTYTTSYTFHHNLDTRGLHTLAELCLRRSDYNPILRTSESSDLQQYKGASGNSNGAYGSNRGVKREHDYSPVESVGESYVDEREDEDSNKIIDVVGDEGSKVGKQNDARLESLDDELEKMLQGNDEIISREVREFLDNNRPSQKEAARISELTQSEITRFLNEGLNIKEEKKTKFYRWYLGKKLGGMDPDDESFTCYKCGKIFAYQSYLERHVKYVCPDKTGRTWKCSYCSKAFQYPCYLRRHMRSHTGESPYKCTQCSRAFVRSTDLQRHLRNHTGEKPYKCSECSRAFARSTDLKRHMRTHTGEKPYKCWQCSKAFSQSGSLQTHLHTHYKESLQMKGVLTDTSKGNKS